MVRELLSPDYLEVNRRRCLRVRHRKSNCRLCLETCPLGAISFSEGLQVDRSLCSGCGICAGVCRNGVFGLRDFAHESMLTSIRQKGEVKFTCFSLPPESDGFRVPCLGYLDEAMLIGIIASGSQAVRLIAGQCKRCRHGVGIRVAGKTVKLANQILTAFGLSKKLSISIGEAGDSYGVSQDERYSRREFFSYIGAKTKSRFAVVTNKANTDLEIEARIFTLSSGLPKKRSILLEQIKKLGQPVIDHVNADDLPFAKVKLGGDCNGCNMCVTFCPTGALRSLGTEDSQVIDFSLGYCLACGLCSEVCPQKTVSYSSWIDPELLANNTRMILVEHRKAACTWCRQMYITVSENNLCLDCRKKKEIEEQLVRVWQQS